MMLRRTEENSRVHEYGNRNIWAEGNIRHRVSKTKIKKFCYLICDPFWDSVLLSVQRLTTQYTLRL
ncbi:hypothetical protein E2C01_005331 [Portunus trituberculatus]|uniref:Uncharacterized protein n=1 Tax=Portunus trituberculatus TaxID=210409 RepID=A0A5B7CS92_PORTR|nr:hypothetical protein [Portunus trituberculatus]